MTSEKSQIRFAKSERTGELIGFVSRHSKTRQLKGVREDSRYGKSAMSRTLDGVLQILRERKDIENHEEVIADFIKQAQEMIRRFEQDGYIYTGKRYMGGGRK